MQFQTNQPSDSSKTIFLTHNLGENLGKADTMTVDYIPDEILNIPRIGSSRKGGKRDRTLSMQETSTKN